MFEESFNNDQEADNKSKENDTNSEPENETKAKKVCDIEDKSDDQKECCKCNSNLRGRRGWVQDCGHPMCPTCTLDQVTKGEDNCPKCGTEVYYSVSQTVFFSEDKEEDTNDKKEKEKTKDKKGKGSDIFHNIMTNAEHVNTKNPSDNNHVNKHSGFQEAPWYFILGGEEETSAGEELGKGAGMKKKTDLKLKTGLAEPLVPSPELAEFLGIEKGEKISTSESIKQSLIFIQHNKLLCYKDRYDNVGLIHPNKKMKPVFGTKPFKRMYMQQIIMKHLQG